jgi:DNA-directed RNA polymerase specialized sigma24 family protein
MAMESPAAYLFRVGQTSARRSRRRQGHLPVPDSVDLPHFEPGLLPALGRLSESQRTAVLLVHAFGWPQSEAADLMGISVSSIRTHLARAVSKLQEVLEVEPHV